MEKWNHGQILPKGNSNPSLVVRTVCQKQKLKGVWNWRKFKKKYLKYVFCYSRFWAWNNIHTLKLPFLIKRNK